MYTAVLFGILSRATTFTGKKCPINLKNIKVKILTSIQIVEIIFISFMLNLHTYIPFTSRMCNLQ